MPMALRACKVYTWHREELHRRQLHEEIVGFCGLLEFLTVDRYIEYPHLPSIVWPRLNVVSRVWLPRRS